MVDRPPRRRNCGRSATKGRRPTLLTRRDRCGSQEDEDDQLPQPICRGAATSGAKWRSINYQPSTINSEERHLRLHLRHGLLGLLLVARFAVLGWGRGLGESRLAV